jgi:hypothetical protein
LPRARRMRPIWPPDRSCLITTSMLPFIRAIAPCVKRFYLRFVGFPAGPPLPLTPL